MSLTETTYAKDLGARLRHVRQSLGLSLQGVEDKSAGVWKAVVVGSYERGDRAITVARLARLAEFYGVPTAKLLPDAPEPVQVTHDRLAQLLRDALDLVTGEADGGEVAC